MYHSLAVSTFILLVSFCFGWQGIKEGNILEVSLSPELMKILESLVGTASRLQYQYLFAIIPALVFFAVYLLIIFRPKFSKTKSWWQTRKFEKESNGTIIQLVHSGPSSFLDMFKLPMISLDDSHKLMQAIKDIPNNGTLAKGLNTP